MRNLLLMGMAMALIAGLTGCASTQSSAPTSPKQVQAGVILQIQPIDKTPTNTANVAHTVGTVGGVSVAGMTGGISEPNLNEQSTLQYIVKLNDDGTILSVVQKVKEPLRPGSHVLVTSGGGQRTHLALDKNYKN